MLYKSSCKINLHLKIWKKLENGYHELETVFQEVPFYDDLEISVLNGSEEIIFRQEGLNIPLGENEDNICVKAAKILKKRCEVEKGCSIVLKKNIPIGAGLGGGSGNAATVLKALNELWELELSFKELEKIGKELGADVPFLIQGGCAYATGIGDELIKIPNRLTNGYLLLCNPCVHIDTKKAYKNMKIYLTKEYNDSIFGTASNESVEIVDFKGIFENDFELYVFDNYPEVKVLKNLFVTTNSVFSLMSGSGSTVFGFFKNRTDVDRVLKDIDNKYFTKIVKV